MARPLTTPQLLRHLRKQEEDWRSNRWGYLLLSLLPIVGNVVALWKWRAVMELLDSVLPEKTLEGGFYLYLGVFGSLIITFVGVFAFVRVIKNWRGNRMRQLLILLAEREPEPKRIPVGPRPKQF
jgi:hypothetical protein